MTYETRLSPNSSGKRPKTLGVVVHSTRGAAASPELELIATANWFTSLFSSVSAHRVIGVDGDGFICVNDDDIAWHARSYNTDWLSVELVQPTVHDKFTEKQYVELARLVGEWSEKFDFLPDRAHIIGHDEIDPKKSDPGALFDWAYFMSLLRSKDVLDKEKLTEALHEIWAVKEKLASASWLLPRAGELSDDLFHAVVKAKKAADIS